MNLVYPLCTLGGLAIGIPLTAVLSVWYDRRRSNVEAEDVSQLSNVTVLDAYRPGSNVRELPRRRWGA